MAYSTHFLQATGRLLTANVNC